jgi:hypothetical protein
MEKHAREMAIVSAAVAFVLCLVGGMWMFVSGGIGDDDLLGYTLGLYFMGKAFFVGPMLYLTALQFPGRQG